MPKIIVRTLSGNRVEMIAKNGRSLMEAIRDGGVDELQALCGGALACATCHIHFDPAYHDVVGPSTEDEDELLCGSDHQSSCSRLSCQVMVDDRFDGLSITIMPPE